MGRGTESSFAPPNSEESVIPGPILDWSTYRRLLNAEFTVAWSKCPGSDCPGAKHNDVIRGDNRVERQGGLLVVVRGIPSLPRIDQLDCRTESAQSPADGFPVGRNKLRHLRETWISR